MDIFPKIKENSIKNYEAIRVAALILVETLEKHLPREELYLETEDGEEEYKYNYERLIELIDGYLSLALTKNHCYSGTCELE